MQSIEAISAVGKRMRIFLWSLVALILVCMVGFPSELGLDIEPMKNSPWVYSFYTILDMLFGPPEFPIDELSLLPPEAFFPPEPLPISMRVSSVAIFFITSLLMASLVWEIDRLFKAYSLGKVFTLETTNHFRCIGWTLVALFIVNSVANYLIEHIMIPFDIELNPPFAPPPMEDLFGPVPPPHEWASMEYISLDFPLLLAGLFMIVIAHVMHLGVQIQADVDATI
ncbi:MULTISPECIES: DUF2975 domain-containing protein [unclassified Agarivorans]|uniref:DUF2975 domain-containing protein n=1 Tax=unclassified Agarivorans TaxID=2636026 RepID=UPI0026E45619|nr:MULTISPECIES: DUF2975 domain-containing protein [unclassified Agarivorans]MDO6686175.1 DUF2975 domain-containing protein [Agarivorans sp. 3_MG-2023]MDO6716376.1 DUF2975 domain-containing protein [Agarivorans sp. 2_MG-2023]